MKLLLTTCFVLITALSLAQDEKNLEAAVMGFRTGLLEGDVDLLRSLTSSDLTYGHSSAVIEDQEAFLKVFSTKLSTVNSWDMSNLEINLSGESIGLVRHDVLAVSTTGGQTNSVFLGVLMVWVKEEGNWKLLARQAFRKNP